MSNRTDDWMSLTGDERDLIRVTAYMVLGLANASLLLAGSPRNLPLKLQALSAWLVPVYLILAANALLHGDDLFADWARGLLVQNHWYEGRRLVQGLLLCVLAWVTLRLLQRPAQAFNAPDESSSWSVNVLRAASLCSLGLTFLRFISFHYTDTLIRWPLWGISLGTWLEAMAVMVAAAALLMASLQSRTYV